MKQRLFAAMITPLVFIHGIKGGKLVDSSGKEVWLTIKQGLSLETPSLSLPLWTGQTQAKDEIRSAGVLDYVVVIPRIFKQSVYGPWLEAAAKFDRPFFPFAYDWRRDNHESLELLLAFLEEKVKAHGKVQVVGHSMGGLLTLAALHKRPEFFKSAVFVGVPFTGDIGFLPDLHRGFTTGINTKILNWEVLGTYPSPYTLFGGPSESMLDEKGQPIPMDFFKAEDWERMKLGYFAPGRTVPPGFKEHLRKVLEKAKAFRELLKPAKISYPPIAVVAGNNFPTLAKAVKKGEEWDFEAAPLVPGDDRVQEKNAWPAYGIPFTRHTSKLGHAALLDDPEVQKVIQSLQ